MPDQYTFVNPYNFIPLSEEKDRMPEKVRKGGKLSGVIKYVLYTKTPLFIPNTSNDHAFAVREDGKDHKSYDFFSYTNLEGRNALAEGFPKAPRPVIPGSEMRGLLRSNYEIITNSCLSSLDTRVVLSKRTMESFRPGLIRKTNRGYDLYAVNGEKDNDKDCLWRTKGKNNTEDELNWKDIDSYRERECYIQDSFPEGAKVIFHFQWRGRKCKSLASDVSLYDKKKSVLDDYEVGYLIKGAPGPGSHQGSGTSVMKTQKHCAHIFCRPLEKERPVWAKIDKKILENLLDSTLKEYKENNPDDPKKNYEEYRAEWEKFKRQGPVGEYFPVYYSKIGNGHFYLSPACKTREVYPINLKELAGNLAPCTKKDELCPACSLFGTLAEDGAVSSRIRVLDLQTEEKDDYADDFLSPVTLKPLSSSKLSNVEFYLKRPDNANFWSYEYYIDARGEIHIQKGTLAGRKFYWHNLSAAEHPEIYADHERNGQNITVRPVRDHVFFKGRIYFERLSEKELNDLLYVLQAGDKDPVKIKKHGLKLGAAKPLGFGSVAMEVSDVILHSYDMDDVAETVAVRETSWDAKGVCDTDQICNQSAFRKITDFEAVKGENICYPKTKPDDEGYVWFTKNHMKFNKKSAVAKFGMANSRGETYLNEYMEALEPHLKKNPNYPSFTGREHEGYSHSEPYRRTNYSSYDRLANQFSKRSAETGHRVLSATVTGVNYKGTVFIDTSDGKGQIMAQYTGNKQWKRGDRVDVVFHHERRYDNGNTVKFYNLTKTKS